MDENIEEKNKNGIFNVTDLVVASAGLVGALVFLVYPTILENKIVGNSNLAMVATASKPNPFLALSIEAKAVYVLDLKTNEVLFEKNSEAQLPLASLSKIMTAIVALSTVPESTIITIGSDDLKLEGDSGLYADERWRLGDLLGLTLVESSNDGAFAVASSVGAIYKGVEDKNMGINSFISLMNEKAKEIGLSQTYFNNPTGLDENSVMAGGYGSARDVALLIKYALENYANLFRNTKYSSVKVDSLNEFNHTANNTNKDLDGIPVIIVSKTGYTELAGGNLVIVFEAGIGRPIAVSVLGSTLQGRFDDVRKLAWAAVDALALENE